MTSYYVRKSGNDANGGTDPDTDAKLTIAGAIAVSTANDIIDIGEGTFSENLNQGYRTYQGAGMFKTVVTGNLLNLSGVCILNDFKFLYNGDDTSNSQPLRVSAGSSFTNFYVDGAGYVNSQGGGFLFPEGVSTLTCTRCIFANIAPSGNYVLRSDASSTLEMINCIMYNCAGNSNWSYWTSTGTLTMINTVWHSCVGAGPSPGTTNITNCASYNNSGAPSSILSGTTNLVTADPLFVDAVGGDFRLQPNSPLIGAGITP